MSAAEKKHAFIENLRSTPSGDREKRPLAFLLTPDGDPGAMKLGANIKLTPTFEKTDIHVIAARNIRCAHRPRS
ncbi:MAG TPA: hypothetical protein VEK55_02425 [Xanthobacteraceae bacterium]|nr:hypothetical protein [Xanthobacteraceae bacterium]